LNNAMTMLVDPTKAFEALAHDARLAVVRLLIPAGRDGLPAGVIGNQIGFPPNALSFHLGRLTNAGLVRMRRVGRNQYYAVDYERLSALVGFLVEDCCANAPDGCMPGCPGMPQAASGRYTGKNDQGAVDT
jgi:DNA-binding transcriptional ArsR family regulator